MLPRTLRSGKRRRALLRASAVLNGIDEIEVVDRLAASHPGLRQRVVFVHCFGEAPASFDRANVRVVGGVRIPDVPVRWVATANAIRDAGTLLPDVPDDERWAVDSFFYDYGPTELDHLLVVRVGGDTGSFAGDGSEYQLAFVASASDDSVPPGFDLELSAAKLFFKAGCPSDFDCPTPEAPRAQPPEAPLPPLPIDLLARDAEALRGALLDRLATRLPAWQERSPADLGVTIVELLAYAGDRLSYLQDAVGTEAYLGTARRRVSMRRHARLLDYVLHEGCSARTWARFEVASSAPVDVPEGTQLRAIDDPRTVFETLHPIRARAAHEAIAIYGWGELDFRLLEGATRATLVANGLALAPGDVLLFQEIASLGSEDADPKQRHVVRLTRVSEARFDALTETAYVEIEWHDEDRLPFDLLVSADVGTEDGLRLGVASGNLALAEHGRTLGPLEQAPLPAEADDPYRPLVPTPAFVVPYAGASEKERSARAMLALDPRRALPAITLDPDGDPWIPKLDLLASTGADRHFVVEVESDGTTSLRFGDGVHGRRPVGGLRFGWRDGGGVEGNVAADVLVTCTDASGAAVPFVSAVTNPLPARGGTGPEPIEDARELAPQSFRAEPLRAITEADYARVASRFGDVQRAVAARRWTGSGYAVFVTIDRLGGRPVDAAFREALGAALEPFRLIGEDVVVESPVYVPLEIVMTVCLAEGYRREDVRAALLDRFGAGLRADGGRGFFHPDELTFGQPIYASRILEAASGLAGVDWADLGASDPRNRFGRLGVANDERSSGRIAIGRTEIARLDGNADRPEDGRIEFLLRGGT